MSTGEDVAPAESTGPLAADVTLLLLDELEERNVRLEQANADLRHFAEVAAHDLRSPLTVVCGYLEQTLRHDPQLSPLTREWLTLALDAGSRVVDLVQSLLAHSTSSGAELVAGPVDLGAVFEEAGRRLSHIIERRRATVRISSLPVVRGDHDLLSLVAQNLMENALKYTADDVTPLIEVTATTIPSLDSALHRTRCIVRIRDNGVGIPPEDRQQVFALFGRGSAARGEGHGIGLATCARIVQRHHGRLSVADLPGPGTTIELELPVVDG